MRLALALLLLATSARAEIAKLGDFALGQEVKKPTTVKAKLFGCSGELRPSTDRKKKVTRVRYEASGCTLASAAAAITKEVGVTPIGNTRGDKVWEGKTSSILMTDRGGKTPLIMLVAPGAGAKRVCFSDDGFAAFWSTFKDAVAGGKRNAIAASFALPLKTFDGTIVVKNASDFLTKYPELFDPADLKEIASGALTADCHLEDAQYLLSLNNSNAELEASRVGGTWKWTERNDVSPD